MNKRRNIKMIVIIIIATILLLVGRSYAYFSVIFQDERTSENNGNTNFNTELLSNTILVSDVAEGAGSFLVSDVYPGHKEVASIKVNVRGEQNSKIGVKFTYEVLENGLNDNVKVSLYKSKKEIETKENYFECEKKIENIENETRYYEECKEKDLELLIAEKTLTGGKEVIELVTDTVLVSKEEETFYYYVVVEFINKETTQNEVMNRVLKGNILVDASIPENKTFEESVVTYGNLGNNIADSILYSDYLDTTNLVYDETVDDNLRYIGKNPNNYVDFNGEKWRIIGVMNNVEDKDGNIDSRIKLIRDESIGEFSWDTSVSDVNSGLGVNEWSQADIMKLMNPGFENESVGGSLYWNRQSGKCYNAINNGNIACNFSLTGLKKESQNFIDNVVWYTGTTEAKAYEAQYYLTSKIYDMERSNNTGKSCAENGICNDNVQRKTKWYGRVGLIYQSDFGYATGNREVRNTCLATQLYNWNNNELCSKNNWLQKKGLSQWTITPRLDPNAINITATNVAYIHFDGRTNGYHATGVESMRINVVPVLFLKSNISITSGNGTKENSYKLELKEGN